MANLGGAVFVSFNCLHYKGVNMKTTIDMARDVKATAYTNRHYPDRTTYTFGPEQLKAFEALIRADERNKQGEAFQQILSSVKACAIADEREAIKDEWWMCVQSDLENGVKSLNEQAATKWRKEYPEIAKFGAWLNARGEDT
jgi:hypothetical protein